MPLTSTGSDVIDRSHAIASHVSDGSSSSATYAASPDSPLAGGRRAVARAVPESALEGYRHLRHRTPLPTGENAEGQRLVESLIPTPTKAPAPTATPDTDAVLAAARQHRGQRRVVDGQVDGVAAEIGQGLHVDLAHHREQLQRADVVRIAVAQPQRLGPRLLDRLAGAAVPIVGWGGDGAVAEGGGDPASGPPRPADEQHDPRGNGLARSEDDAESEHEQRCGGDLRDTTVDLMRDQMSADEPIGSPAAYEETRRKQPKCRVAYHLFGGDRRVAGAHSAQRSHAARARCCGGAGLVRTP